MSTCLGHDVRPGRGQRLELQLRLRLGVERVLREAERRRPAVVGARLAGVAAKRRKSGKFEFAAKTCGNKLCTI